MMGVRVADSIAIGGGEVRPVILGSGSLVIAVPVIGSDRASVRKEWAQAANLGANLIEWRYDAVRDSTGVSAGNELRRRTGIPTIFTVRRAEEGGNFHGDSARYVGLVEAGATWSDLVDVEFEADPRGELVQTVGQSGKIPVLSHHVFDRPVEVDFLKEMLSRMEEAGAGIAKVAWMVRDREELQQILDVQAWAAETLAVPAVIIGMGAEGAPTRLGTAARRSAFTFAVGEAPSAPGQLTVAQVREADTGSVPL